MQIRTLPSDLDLQRKCSTFPAQLLDNLWVEKFGAVGAAKDSSVLELKSPWL